MKTYTNKSKAKKLINELFWSVTLTFGLQQQEDIYWPVSIQ